MAVSNKAAGKSSGAKSAGKGKSRKSTKASSARSRKPAQEVAAYQDYQAFQVGVTIFVLLIISVFIYLSCFGLAGKVGMVVGGLFFGIFGWFVWFLPFACLIGFVFCVVNRGDKRVPRKMFGFAGIVLALLGLSDQIFGKEIITEYYTSNHVLHRDYFECMFLTCSNVMAKGKFNGGLIGRAVGTAFSVVIGRVGAVVILFVLLFLCLYIFYGVEMMGMIRKRNAYRQEMEEMYGEVSKEEDYREPSYRVFHETVREVPSEDDRWRAYPSRGLEKAPKVQTFDLSKMGRGEEASPKESDILEKPSKRQTVKKEPTEEEPAGIFGTWEPREKIKKERLEVRESDAAREHIATEERRTDPQEMVSAREEPAVHPEIEAIPIYRNELNEKFGKKRRTAGAKVVSVASAAEKKTYEASEPAGHEEKRIEKMDGTEDRAYRPKEDSVWREESKETSGVDFMQEKPNDIIRKDPVWEEEPRQASGIVNVQEEPEETARTAAVQEEPEEAAGKAAVQEEPEETARTVAVQEEPEETAGKAAAQEESREAAKAVTVQEETEETARTVMVQEEQIGEPQAVLQDTVIEIPDLDADTMPEVMELAERTVQRPSNPPSGRGQGAMKPKTASHGKIGGDDYVSASDTFNALNESKVAEESGLPYEFPLIDLLSVPEGTEGRISDDELRQTALKLQDTLKSFNVNVKMGAVTCGPAVTRYELFPEQGVRVNKITNLADDLKLSLAAASIRIEAPIPGKAAVGIEVPNPVQSPVFFRELLEGDAFVRAKSDMTFAVGKDIAGKLILADIAKMPHLLIAGATGSGKSVCINTLIMSILYKADPKDVKLIMIDPKVVELSVYNGIPHLFCPVVTDPKEAAAALNWAVREMMDRYNKFKELGVRNIGGYNEKILTVENAEAAGYARMPYLVVIVDEFADLMMVASKEVEDAVCRLAQLARAAGIHLVLATQRPSVNVITGVIKANIPSRIAFSVSSVIDSRTILDKGGAEKLLGKGDMLFFPSGYSEPVRVQGAFVSDKEVSDVVEFLRSNNETPEYDHSVTQVVEEPEEEKAEKKPQDDRDEYFEEAGRFVIESERAAAGQLQRRFSIGFNRAGRIIDQLNKAGVVGPAEGTKPRKVLMTIEEFEQMLSGGSSISDDEMESMVQEMEAEVVTTEEMF